MVMRASKAASVASMLSSIASVTRLTPSSSRAWAAALAGASAHAAIGRRPRLLVPGRRSLHQARVARMPAHGEEGALGVVAGHGRRLFLDRGGRLAGVRGGRRREDQRGLGPLGAEEDLADG